MWPRAGGHVSPPASTVLEILPARNSLQSPSPLYLSSSCVVTIFTWSPSYPLMQYQPALQMPLEFRSAPGVYQRMYRSVQPPYRLQSFNERLQRFRPITSSQLGAEEESAEQIINVDAQEGPPRFVIKRHGRNHSINRQDLSVFMNPTRSNTEELQIIPSDEWARHPSRYTQWQADEPQIVITSDVQLQTDDSEPIYETRSRLERRRSTTDLHVSSTTNTRSQLYHQSFHGFPAQNSNTSTGGIYEPVPGTVSDYRSSNNSYPLNNVTVNVTMDRATQIPPEPQEPIEIIDLDPEETVDLVSDSDDIIDLVSVSSDKSDNEEDTIPVMTHKLYARPAPVHNLPASTMASRQAANSVIKHARNNKTLNEKALHCLNCDLIPILPVTGQCGHTRCTKCIQNNGSCPCGAEAPKSLHVNTVIQYLIGKMLPNDLSRRGHPSSIRRSELSDDTMPGSLAGRKDFKGNSSTKRTHSSARSGRSLLSMRIRAAMPDINVRMPLAPQIQFEHARRLLSRGLYRDAASHFARVAASSEPLAHTARSLLSQIIVVLAEGRDPRRITRDLFKSVRLQSAASWLRASDLECGLCYHSYTKPVTTPCGHTYCRTCIERALDYRKVCSLCMRPLEDFDLTTTRETLFVSAALEAIDESRPTLPPDPDVIPIFVCTVAYPAIPCPLFIFDPRYWLMIRRVLESGSRKFGMVAYERDRNYSDYGTVLQVCDCVQLEDGRSFLSTVGVSRFRVIERDVMDGCDVARIQPLIDITPTEPIATLDIRLLGSQILYKAVMWLNGMDKTVRCEIESAFGQIPRFDRMQDAWWESPDGPAWLWWLVAILPLRSEIKVLILSTKNLLKRMMAVSRTLEAIDQVAITTTSTSECEIRSALTNAEEWLERGS